MAYQPKNANGQATMANSEPVVIASNQSAVPVSFTGSTDVATQTTLAAINAKLVSGTDIGDVTINNAAGVAAVNIQDGGNTITVDGTVALGAGAAAIGIIEIGATSLAALETINAAQSGTWNIGTTTTVSTVTNLAQIAGVAPKVLAASVAAVATDTALVVAVSPNNTVPVSLASVPSHAVTNAGTFATQVTSIAAGDNNIGNVDIVTMPTVTVNAHAVTNAGTFVVQENGAALTALQLIDDTIIADNAGFTDGTTKLGMAGFIYDEVAGTALTENDAAAARIDVKRAQIGTIEDGVTRGRYATVSAANALKVDGSAVTQPVSLTSTTVTGTVAVTDNAGSLTVDAPVATPVFVRISSGAAAVDTLPVSLASVPSHAVTNAGTFAVQAAATLAAETTKVIGTVNLSAAQTLATVTTCSTVTNLAQMGGVAIALNTGVRAAGVQRVTVATDDIVQVKSLPDATATYAPTNATTTAYAASLVVKAGTGNLFMLSGYNSKTSAQFIQIHNTASLPIDTSVPVVVFYVPGQTNFSFDFGPYGRNFATGITVCNSSTGPTKTIGSADCWFDAQYK